jgi:hypothetical protein
MNSSLNFGQEAADPTLPQRLNHPLRSNSNGGFLKTPALCALAVATMFSFAGPLLAQGLPAPKPAMKAADLKAAADKAKADLELALAHAKNPIPKPHHLLGVPFNPQAGPQLIALVDQMLATAAAARTPAQVGPALDKILKMWPQHQQLLEQMDTQLEQIAAHDLVGKKTPEMKNVETAVAPALAAKAQAMEAELLRLSKLPLSPKDMAALQSLQKALAG